MEYPSPTRYLISKPEPDPSPNILSPFQLYKKLLNHRILKDAMKTSLILLVLFLKYKLDKYTGNYIVVVYTKIKIN